MIALSMRCALVALLALQGASSAKAEDLGSYRECWRASFTEQSSGPVRRKTTPGGPYNKFISIYDGDFRWHGEPTTTPVALTYVYCFHARADDGGAVMVDGKAVALDQVGSIRLPPSGRSAMGQDFVVIRDPDIYASLYGAFGSGDQGGNTLEIQLDRLHGTTTVTTLARRAKAETLVYMKGDAVRLHP